MSLKNIHIKGSYTGMGEKILTDFLLPTLKEAISYDRITGYFTVDSLISIANGIESLHEKKGKMRLIIGIHSLPEELIDATLKKNELTKEISKISHDIEKGLKSISDLLDKKRVATLAWMIEDGLLTVKTAAVQGNGIFHPKTIIIEDEANNKIAAIGSPNETKNGLGGNFEQLMVAASWNNPDAVNNQEDFFNQLWNNQRHDAIVADITKETLKMIKNALGNEYDVLKNSQSCLVNDVLNKISDMPVNFFTSGNIPSLYMHQERAVIDALSRWPVRVLFSDEVGLGKTFEAAATMAFLNKYCNVERIIVLTPKSVLKQWQDELKTNFGLDAWMYDSSKKEYISANGSIIKIGNKNPLGKKSPNLILMSAQFARGNKTNKGLLSEKDTILPQLLVVDEAHSARISQDITGNNKKTQMYKMLENVSKKIPHIILATATPMQKNASEYHAMLKILGLPKIWEKEENFSASLRYIQAESISDLSDANKIVSLLHYTNTIMKPDLSVLTNEENDLLDRLEILFANKDNFEKANFVKEEWPKLKNIFIKLHPAKLLTIRNTRRSLSEIGYKFPKRNLHEKSLYSSDRAKLFYADVNHYLEEDCFSVEKELNPEKKLNISFIRISYQQRVASSLYSCKTSLQRRLDKIKFLHDSLQNNNYSLEGYSYENDFDNFDDDELLDLDISEDEITLDKSVNLNNLHWSVDKEYLTLCSLVKEADFLLKSEGDQKIKESIELALNVLKSGDSVLLFSRYTDTVDALVKYFNEVNKKLDYNYAIYTGNKSSMIRNNKETECTKEQIKQSLFSKDIKIVFCSDAASEGLNLQAARVLINVDVPWTPSRLEQRIGRIARLGQTADEVDIYNIWYPDSVEAKMYHRIQNRFKTANIAVGEFPDVVADNIKRSILCNEEDKSLAMLKDIRNNLQKGALDELWANDNQTLTKSDEIRVNLIELCKANYNLISEDKKKHKYIFKSTKGNTIEFTDLPGQKESINLKSPLISDLKINISGFELIKNDTNSICIVDSNNNKIVTTESLIYYLTSNDVQDCSYYETCPVSLANPHKLDLSYAVEDSFVSTPIFWPKEGELL